MVSANANKGKSQKGTGLALETFTTNREVTMGMRVTTNVASVNAQRSMAGVQRDIQKTFAQLSSGSRITKAADDAAGLSISEGLKATSRSLQQAIRNSNDGISMVQVAEGGLNEISNIMTRLRELGIQAASDTVGERERGFINNEVKQLVSEADRISKTTRFGGVNLIDGTGVQFDFQVGTNNDQQLDRISYNAEGTNATVSNLGIEGMDFSTKEGAQGALNIIDEAQTKTNGFRSDLGALQNRLTSTVDNLAVTYENVMAANSRIRDTDLASATADLTRNNILMNGSISTLAQANSAPQMALKLIG
jgi:flagellin